MRWLKQNTAANVCVLMVLSNDRASPASSFSSGDLTIKISKNGGSFSTISVTAVNLGNGWYSIPLTISHTDTLGELLLHVEANTADPYDEKYLVVGIDTTASIPNQVWDELIVSHVVPGSFGTGISGSSSATIAGAVWDVTVSGHTTAGTFGEMVGNGISILRGLVHENTVIDNQAYTSGLLTSARVRSYDTKTNALAAGATGVLWTFTITIQYTGTQISKYTLVRE